MELLRDLRVETQQAEAITSAKAIRKRKAMEARLKKVRQRKRLKMGLPMKGKISDVAGVMYRIWSWNTRYQAVEEKGVTSTFLKSAYCTLFDSHLMLIELSFLIR